MIPNENRPALVGSGQPVRNSISTTSVPPIADIRVRVYIRQVAPTGGNGIAIHLQCSQGEILGLFYGRLAGRFRLKYPRTTGGAVWLADHMMTQAVLQLAGECSERGISARLRTAVAALRSRCRKPQGNYQAASVGLLAEWLESLEEA